MPHPNYGADIFDTSDPDIREAIRDTNAEIFYAAFDQEPPSDNYDTSLEDMEDWNGNPVPLSEFAREVNGDVAAGMAGVALSEREEQLEAQLEEANARAEQAREVSEHAIAAYRSEFRHQSPERIAEARAHVKDQLYRQHGIVFSDDKAGDTFLDALAEREGMMANAASQLHSDRINHSMDAARNQYGEDFDKAFSAIMESGDREAAARVMASANPGAALMQYRYGTAGLPSLNSGQSYGYRSGPSSSRAPSRTDSWQRNMRDLMRSPDHEETEADKLNDAIFASAWGE